jgi:cytoskeletal protein RodZ
MTGIMSQLSPLQAEQIKEIGTYLRQKREESSLSMEDIAAMTMIRVPMLEALETGNWEKLPELIYVKGFIKRYGDALKIDGKALADRLSPSAEQLVKEATTPKTLPTKVTPIAKTEPVAPKAERVKPEKPAPETSSQPAKSGSFGMYLWLGLLAGLFCGIGYLFLRPPISNTPPVPPSPSPVTSPSPVVSPSPVALPSPSPQPKVPLSARVTIEQPAWVRVIADGKKVYEGTLQAGAKQTWTAQKSLNIRSGNAGGVKISLNEQPAQLMGKAGQIGEITLTAPPR